MSLGKHGNIVIVILSIIVSVFGVAITSVQYKALRAERVRLNEEKQMMVQTQARLQAMDELKKKAPEIEQKMDILSRLLPQDPAEENLIIDFQSGADLSGLSFTQIRFAERIKQGEYVEMPVILKLEGSYYGMIHFVEYINAYERAVRIHELMLRSDADTKDKMSINIKASTFYVNN